MTSTSVFQHARFLLSAAKVGDFPPEAGPEIAFAGRSNVGKSSAINALARRRRLAFSSKTPGRTQTVNFFALGGDGRLADLPGYGYASAPRSTRAGWDDLIGGYLQQRRTLAGVVLLVDARHPLTKSDRHFLEWLRPTAAPLLVLLSKADKLSRAERTRTLAETSAALARMAFAAQVQLFSSASGDGVPEVRALLEGWLANKKPPEKGN
jgi:GTP-binding protein